mgnify:CR=1 FL=1
MSSVRYEVDEHVATLTIDREQSLNALDAEVLADLRTALDTVSDDVRCLVVTGAGQKAFVAGADIAAMVTMSRGEARAFSELGNGVFRALEKLPIPSIAAIGGYALGGGCELALACDIRVASTRAVFGQPEVGLGITAGFGGTQRLARTVGVGIAKELLYSARRIDADRALQIGLVNAVVAPEELLATATALAREIASQAPGAVRATKRALTVGLPYDIDSAIAVEAECFASCFESADQREAMAAFVGHRKPAPFQDK